MLEQQKMVVKRRHSPSNMSSSSIQVNEGSILPLHQQPVSSDEEEYETYNDDCKTYDGPPFRQPLIRQGSGHSSSSSSHVSSSGGGGSSTDSLPLWTPQSARQALHMELSNVHNHQHLHAPILPSTIQDTCSGGGGGQHGRNTLVFRAIKRKHPLFFAISVFCAVGLYLYATSHATLHNSLEQVTRLTEQRRQVRHSIKTVEHDIRQLQKELVSLHGEGGYFGGNGNIEGDGNGDGGDDLSFQTWDPNDKESVMSEMMILEETLKEGSAQIGSLQKHLQETSKKDAIAKYGAGLIRVELELEFPDSPDGPNLIVMEMASLNIMPHSVYIFLEMVHEKLFDGCSFILNAMHVIKAAPLPYDGSSASAKVKAFTKRGLESVAFREYSTDFPHAQNTVGFAADGSPSFYINTQDNTDIHIGDPCFAKIVAGFDTVKRLEQAPTRNGIWFKQRIGLKRARIL